MIAGVVLAPSAVDGSTQAIAGTGAPIYLQTCSGPLKFSSSSSITSSSTKSQGGTCSTIELDSFSLSIVGSAAPKSLATSLATRQDATVDEGDATMGASEQSVALLPMLTGDTHAKSWTVSFVKGKSVPYLSVTFLEVVLTSWTLTDPPNGASGSSGSTSTDLGPSVEITFNYESLQVTYRGEGTPDQLKGTYSLTNPAPAA